MKKNLYSSLYRILARQKKREFQGLRPGFLGSLDGFWFGNAQKTAMREELDVEPGSVVPFITDEGDDAAADLYEIEEAKFG